MSKRSRSPVRGGARQHSQHHVQGAASTEFAATTQDVTASNALADHAAQIRSEHSAACLSARTNVKAPGGADRQRTNVMMVRRKRERPLLPEHRELLPVVLGAAISLDLMCRCMVARASEETIK